MDGEGEREREMGEGTIFFGEWGMLHGTREGLCVILSNRMPHVPRLILLLLFYLLIVYKVVCLGYIQSRLFNQRILVTVAVDEEWEWCQSYNREDRLNVDNYQEPFALVSTDYQSLVSCSYEVLIGWVVQRYKSKSSCFVSKHLGEIESDFGKVDGTLM